MKGKAPKTRARRAGSRIPQIKQPETITGTQPPKKGARLARPNTQQPQPRKRPFGSPTGPEPELLVEQVSPAARLQNQQGNGNSAQPKQPRKRTRLTRENLKLLNKMTKKGEKGAKEASTPTSMPSNPTTKTSISTTMSGFDMQARKNGILNALNSKPPTNIAEIRKRYAHSRRTASPIESEHQSYMASVARRYSEATLVHRAIPRLLKTYNDDFPQVLSQAITGLPNNAGFHKNLSAPRPDFVEGLTWQSYLPFPVDEYLPGALLYRDNTDSLVLPHIAGEWKAFGKDLEVARKQSSFDGAALVYARNQALSYLGKPDPPGHAEVTTFTTDGALLNIYAHYAAPSEDGTLHYHQYLVESISLFGSRQALVRGRRGLRNLQDHAREQSYALRDKLKQHWKEESQRLRRITEEYRRHVSGADSGEEVASADDDEVQDDDDEIKGDDDEVKGRMLKRPFQHPPTAPSKRRKTSPSVPPSNPLPPNSIPASSSPRRNPLRSSRKKH